MAKTPAVSLASLNARKAGETPFAFNLIGPDGKETEIVLKVLGAQSDAVTRLTSQLINTRRREEAERAAQASSNRPGDAITPVEDDVVFGQRLAAVRLVGWEGIEEPWSPDLALQLCQMNSDIAAQVTAQSNKTANFINASPKA